MLSESIMNLLHRVAKNEGFSDYQIDTQTGSSHGDNYVGIMTAVTIAGTKPVNGQNQYEKLQLFCKTSPLDENRKKILKSNLVFDREIYVYSQVLPALMAFQKSRGLGEIDSFSSFPKVFACEANEKNGNYILIMEDMRAKNYEMWPKEKVISLDHELHIMREFGKLHGISFAMKNQQPDEFYKFKQLKDIFVDVVFHGLFRSFALKSIERAENTLKNPKHKEFMHMLRSDCINKITNYLSGPCNTDFGIIRHGDCWTNNFLFRYSDKNVCSNSQ